MHCKGCSELAVPASFSDADTQPAGMLQPVSSPAEHSACIVLDGFWAETIHLFRGQTPVLYTKDLTTA
jgi:hypothetical protein